MAYTQRDPPARRLARVLLPGHLGQRAPAAAGLSAWLAVPIGIVCFGLAAELIAYVYFVAQNFLQVIYGQWEEAFQIPQNAAWVLLEVAMKQVRPHVFDPAASGDSLTVLAGGLLCAAGLLESINLVMLAPFAAGYGQSLREACGATRRVLLLMGGVWLLECSLVWVVLFLGVGAVALYSCQTLRPQVAYLTLDNMIRLGFGAVLLLVLLCWLGRLVHAVSYLPTMPKGPLPERCSQCGYLLAGIPTGSNCPDCGQASPSDPDKDRLPSPWLGRRQTGRLRTLGRVSAAVGRRPGEFFAQLQVLCDHREVLRFVRWNLWLCVGAWVLAVPGIASALIGPDEFLVINEVVSAVIMAGLVALACALTGVLLLGLVISLMGFAVRIAREEPSWPIAAEAGCYLSAWLPRVSAWQALWVTVLFTVEQLVERGLFLRLARHAWVQTGIPWEIVLSVIFGLPLLVGLLVMVWAGVVCYRKTRYACR